MTLSTLSTGSREYLGLSGTGSVGAGLHHRQHRQHRPPVEPKLSSFYETAQVGMLAHRGAPELFGFLVEPAVGSTKSGFTPRSPDQGPKQGSCLYTFGPVGFGLTLPLSELTNGLHMTNVSTSSTRVHVSTH